MIQIQLNTTKETTLFLQRNNIFFSAQSGYYVFETTSQQTQKQKSFLVEDISSHPANYQCFQITVTGGTESVNNSIVKLPVGKYDFKIYPSSAGTINDITPTHLLEVGHLFVNA